MKKIIWDEQNNLRKEIYILLISVSLFLGAIFFSEKYLNADEVIIKPSEIEVSTKLNKLVDEGKITKEQAELKLEAILSGDMRMKMKGKFPNKPSEIEVRTKLNKLVDEGKITEEQAELKLEAILSGDMRIKMQGRYAKKP